MPQMDIVVDDNNIGLLTVGWNADDTSRLLIYVTQPSAPGDSGYATVKLDARQIAALRAFLNEKFPGVTYDRGLG